MGAVTSVSGKSGNYIDSAWGCQHEYPAPYWTKEIPVRVIRTITHHFPFGGKTVESKVTPKVPSKLITPNRCVHCHAIDEIVGE